MKTKLLGPLGDVDTCIFISIICQLIIQKSSFSSLWEIVLQGNATEPHKWEVNIGSGDGLVPPGTKPLPEPMLTKIYVAICHHQATMS